MILKRIYEEYNFSVELIVIKEYKKLKLTQDEVTVLLVLFSIHRKRKTFSVNAIARRLDFSQNEIAPIIESLMDKGFISINIESNNKREREVFDLDGTFGKIESMFREQDLLREQQKNETNVSHTIDKLEEKFARMLRPNELEKVRSWYEDSNYDHDRIISAIDFSDGARSLNNIEKILSANEFIGVEIDEKTDAILDSIFKKL